MTISTEADIAAGLAALRAADVRLEAVIERAGTVPLRRRQGGLAGLVAIIVGQQVSRASADAILARLAVEIAVDSAPAILAASDEAFRRAGMSRPKQQTLLAVAQAIETGSLDFRRIGAAPAEAAIAELVAVRGIGPWTAECYLLFCGGHPDVFPAGDLALQVAVGHAFGLASRPTARDVSTLAAAWSPHRSVAARLFWSYYAAVTRRDAVPIAGAAA
ncbi:MAG: DNA-3-methyladenine glycosylase 2 family protein [Aurantimonas endophytica]|uniref:DNA-3-methyladenine glycosylase II n=1 Tax=Aurantimonas endophytica TaxID=1522175 RepID=A0A7W6MS23_9HYPH|nr:DNA-3-methyladenine glycosylase 2 family protein [Aurantimonas endophytica]MBB4005672.1 DNA-3-methyladenine glycosylase II [Aurantimonas endophytica]MCO6406378.1 DNA-3-methyladenine glycosylase 2 family protein [Aurantimonas endophytica]